MAHATAQQWALITGVSAGGLGDALAGELMLRGVNVIATAIRLDVLNYLPSVADTKSARLEKLQLDVTNSTSIADAAFKAASITNGRLDFLFNNAGYGYMMPLLDADVKAVKQNFDVNVFGLLAVTQTFFPLLREAKGVVVNQCSIAGLTGCYQPVLGSYAASKSAVAKLSDTLRVEMKPFGVKVVTLMTGDVQTRFWDNVQGAHKGLPSESVYGPVKDRLEKMMRGETNPPGQHPRQRWAKEVVGDVLRASPSSHIRRGYLARTMWVVSFLLPFWLLDFMYTQASGLAKWSSADKDLENKKGQ